MKYIKFFNHINEDIKNEDLYELIDIDVYSDRSKIHGEDEGFNNCVQNDNNIIDRTHIRIYKKI